MKTVAIFGAGLAGMTTADELSQRGYNVFIFENQKNIGGLARSSSSNCDIPTEVSWRGIGPFYHNMLSQMSSIPLGSSENVLDYALSKPIKFDIVDDKLEMNISHSLSVNDKTILALLLFKFKVSSFEIRSEWWTVNAAEFLSSNLSEKGSYVLINSLGPFIGVDKTRCSMYQFLNFYSMVWMSDYKPTYHNDNWNLSSCKFTLGNSEGCNLWSLFSASSQDVLFKPWKIKLQHKGVMFFENHSLEFLSVDEFAEKVKYVGIKTPTKNIMYRTFDEYVLAVGPFSLYKILKNTTSLKLENLYQQTHLLIQDGPHFQIPFTIAFSEPIKMDRCAYIFGNSPYNITLYFQSDIWQEGPYPQSRTFWSGTTCVATEKGILFGKPVPLLTKKEFFSEVLAQISASSVFDELVKKNNSGKSLKYFLKSSKQSTFSTFKFSKKGLTTSEPKWVNSTTNEKFRPTVNTTLNNMFLAGAYVQTTMSLYSMEGAVESGLQASNEILKKYNQPVINIFKH